MMTFNRYDFAGFFTARSRTNMTALEALKELEGRGITGAPFCITKQTATALCDSICQKAGKKINELTSHELAAVLRGE